ncbi:ECF transporter S component [Neobacillus sp. NPDC058068]|uniref:ECF transporter S component n=1 Tax=Neobacillus sp. NPDC058068 TaxID=3346325 RepID=UPI0036DF579E
MKKIGIKHDFSVLAITLIPIGIALNVTIGQIVSILKLPLFLDTAGTIVVGMIAGPWVGLITGGLSNLVRGIVDPVLIAFAPVSMAMGLLAGLLSYKGMVNNLLKAIIAGVMAGIISVVIATPITVMVFGGISGTGSDVITAFFLAAGFDMWQAVTVQKIIIESIDRILCFFIAYWIVKKMSARYLVKHNYGASYIKN